jgi:predicted DNA-binding protein
MAGRLYRTQILLEPEQHQALAQIAAQEGRSISDVVREIIQHSLQERQQAAATDLERYLAGLDEIRRHRAAVLAETGGQPLAWDVVAEINQMREERDDRNLGLRSDSD